jgi:hypothetical protein
METPLTSSVVAVVTLAANVNGSSSSMEKHNRSRTMLTNKKEKQEGREGSIMFFLVTLAALAY